MASQSKRTLPKSEWAFHLVPENQRFACLTHERQRERGVPWEAWLCLSEKSKQMLIEKYVPRDLLSLRDGEDAALGRELLRDANEDIYEQLVKEGKFAIPKSVQSVTLELDWAASDEKLKLDFELWLRCCRKTPGTSAFKFKGSKGKPGRRLSNEDRLAELAVFRAVKAGYKLAAINSLLAPLLEGLKQPKQLDSRQLLRMRGHAQKWLHD